MGRKIYLATSWRNPLHSTLVYFLRNEGHEVYDFKHPKPGDIGFSWDEVSSFYKNWTPDEFRSGLEHPAAVRGFTNDDEGMAWADTCVLLLPSGKSAHMELGYAAGNGKDTFVLMLEPDTPELMYKWAVVCTSAAELVGHLRHPFERRVTA